ncbi:hypothetical protein ABB02_01883 [Clostridiaceae bacterium JG1575]|nr:hypothetical protein ABB02_01883 [Clostridiaceae bacterium JG1575]
MGCVATWIWMMAGPGKTMAYAEGDLGIRMPGAGHTTTTSYVVRFFVSPSLTPSKVALLYRDREGKTVRVQFAPPIVPGDTGEYASLIEKMGTGSNTLRLEVVRESGSVLTKERTIQVDPTKTNILTQPVNTPPYTTNPHAFKNLLSKNHRLTAQEYGIPPKDDAYISRFVDLLLAQAQAESIRPDVVFAQIMLETGWLGAPGVVSDSQFNFGGIGATGGQERGNVFVSVQQGLQVNVQHLLAYADTTMPLNPLVDPRFHYVPRANAPYVEELGYYENVHGGGWAMGAQYGYHIRRIMKELSLTDTAPFSPRPQAPEFLEVEVARVLRDQSNPLNIRIRPDLKPGQELRAAAASTSDTLQRFHFFYERTGQLRTTPWSEDGAVFELPATQGQVRVVAQLRARGGSGIEKSEQKIITLGDSGPALPLAQHPALIGRLQIAPGPYLVGRAYRLEVGGVGEEADGLNEYRLSVEAGGTKKLLADWGAWKHLDYTPLVAGEQELLLESRNRLKGSDPEDACILRIVALTGPSAIQSVEWSKGPYEMGQPMTAKVTAASLTDPLAYRLYVCQAEEDIPLTPWQTNPLLTWNPAIGGKLALRVALRNQKTQTVEMGPKKSMEVALKEISPEGPSGYSPENPFGVGVTLLELPEEALAGQWIWAKWAGHSEEPLWYRALLMDEQGRLKKVLTPWQTASACRFMLPQGAYQLRILAKHPQSKSFYDAAVQQNILGHPKARRIYLDVPHGAQDYGVNRRVGAAHYAEKNFSLFFARDLKTELERRGFVCELSRAADVYLSRQERSAKASASGADLLLSLHVMESSDPSYEGVGTLYPTQKTKPEAQQALGQSKAWATLMVQDLLPLYSKHQKAQGDERQRQLLLREVPMPALRVHLGYLSNDQDFARLRTTAFRRAFCQRLAQSLEAHWDEVFPPNLP